MFINGCEAFQATTSGKICLQRTIRLSELSQTVTLQRLLWILNSANKFSHSEALESLFGNLFTSLFIMNLAVYRLQNSQFHCLVFYSIHGSLQLMACVK